MTNAWDAVRAAIDAEDTAAVAALLIGFDDAQRREVARELPRYLPVVRRAGERRDAERVAGRQGWWRSLHAEAERADRSVWDLPGFSEGRVRWYVGARWIEVMRVAGAGAIAGAAGVAAWLNRRELVRGWVPAELDDVPAILDVVAARPVAWREDLAARLALRLRAARPQERDGQVLLALALLRATGVEPPRHDPLTLAWIAAAPVADLGVDPLLDAMVPRLFEAEGVGRLLRRDYELGPALAALAADGRIKRAALLDGCRTRFLRGGQAADLLFFVELHTRLDPAPEEVAPHARDYAAMLALPAANVADLALRQLRQAGVTPPAEAAESLLFRSEGRLVRAGLSLLDRVLKEPSEEIDAYAPALAAALTSGSAEARQRAVRLAVGHAGRFGPEATAMIRDIVATLPPGPGAALAAAFGGEAAPEPPRPRFQPQPLPAVPEPEPMPPITHANVLARVSLRESDWMQPERWLDGFVRLASDERRESLIAELAPVAARCRDQEYRRSTWHDTSTWAAAMARELIEPGADRRAVRGGRADAARRVPKTKHLAMGRLMPLARFAEVYQSLLEGRMPPYLLATPTRANGLLDAEALVERLEGYERDGVQALPLDLRQALLRLGRGSVTAGAVRRAALLAAPAGRRAHRWLTDRPADPEVVLRWTTDQDDSFVEAEVVLGPEHAELFGDLPVPGPGGESCELLPPVPRPAIESCELLLPVLAGHRGLAAAFSIRGFMPYRAVSEPAARDLDRLVLADGPGGPCLALLLARHLLEGPDGDGVRPLLLLAASGGLPGAELGRQLAALLERGQGRAADAIAALTEAARLGAHREVWQVLTGLLPAYLPGTGERATGAHVRLVRFATEVAGWTGARGELPVVAGLAARARTSELVRQARDLHALLTGPA
ncbi:hypothetical protein HD597_004709 [Nonomuraea thailandensis]|uniref:Secreted protein n=1 Tax=Nonomuraea thailandensis TaxID=1188745 RepID=A0A9X2GEM0_9ACTN|nr:DUF6493 family protein [Nonomuraea thailandensis]MCP2357689.1 hypothetical protein [Nonomuraea thailandensis]